MSHLHVRRSAVIPIRKRVLRVVSTVGVIAVGAAVVAPQAQALTSGPCALPRFGQTGSTPGRGNAYGSVPAYPLAATGSRSTLLIPVDFPSPTGGSTGPGNGAQADLTAAVPTLLDAGPFGSLSRGQFSVSTHFANASPTWLRMPHESSYYNTKPYELLDDAMALASAQFGNGIYSSVDFVGAILPTPYRANATTRPFTAPGGATIQSGYRAPVNADQATLAHETLHGLGLADLYIQPSDSTLTAGYDIMASHSSPWLAPLAAGQLGLEWIGASQVVCVPGTTGALVSAVLPIDSTLTSGKKVLSVPLSTSRELTVEVRAPVAGETPGCRDGVVITLVNTASIDQTLGTAIVQRPSGSCPSVPGGAPGAWPAGATYTEPTSGLKVEVLWKGSDNSYGVRIVPKARYANSVLATTGLAAFWRLGEPRAVRLLDQPTLSGRIHDSAGTPANAGLASDGATPAAGTYGLTGPGLGTSDTSQYFGGTRHVTVPTVYTGSDFTVSAWTKVDSGAPSGYVFGGEGGASIKVGQTSVSFTADRLGGTATSATIATASNVGTWVHWALVASGSQLVVYRNGVAVGTYALSAGTTAVGGQIGAYGGALRFKGGIDDVAVFSTGLTAAKISQLYAAAITP